VAECRPWEGGQRERGRLAPQDLRGRDRRHRLDLDVGAGLISVGLQEHVADAQGRALVMGDDDLDLLHVGHHRGDDYRRHRVYRVRLRGRPRPAARRPRAATGRRRGGHSLGPPHLGTWIVKSTRHVVAAGDLDATETAGPMTPGERCRG
jgi:hypothetical protein